MNNIDLYPEFGYLIDSHLNTVNCISKSGYISIISNKLYTEKGNELWQESDLVNLLYIKFGITSIDELDLNNPTQLDFYSYLILRLSMRIQCYIAVMAVNTLSKNHF